MKFHPTYRPSANPYAYFCGIRHRRVERDPNDCEECGRFVTDTTSTHMKVMEGEGRAWRDNGEACQRVLLCTACAEVYAEFIVERDALALVVGA